MSNVEHLFENALLALENDYYFGEWKRIETDRHNTDGVSEEVIEAIWELAIYTKYTYEPSIESIPIELKRALEIFEYNKAMLTCDMSIGRDPEHQDVSPDYYGKDAEDLYNAIVCVEKYIKNAIPIEWIKKYIEDHTYEMVNPKYVDDMYNYIQFTEKPFDYNLIVMPIQVKAMLTEWKKENESNI